VKKLGLPHLTEDFGSLPRHPLLVPFSSKIGPGFLSFRRFSSADLRYADLSG